MRLRDRALGWFVDPDPDGQRFDATFGTETRWYDLGNYEPTPVRIVEQVLSVLPMTPPRTLVDLGSGKGRVVLLASRLPFVRTVGIEIRPALHRAAERNRAAFVARADGPLCPIHLLCGDAAHHPLPDGPLVVWWFNPFGADVVGAVLDRLVGRDALLVYVTPTHRPLVEGAGFRPIASGGDGDWPWQLFGPS
jgi:SAM-dependent methyltransferase